MEIPKMKILDNGLRVIHIPFNGIDTATIMVGGLAGAQYELEDEIGVAHLLEHLVFDGTKKYPTSTSLESILENVGGYNNAYTSHTDVRFYARVLKEDLAKGFDFLSQVLIEPLLTEEYVTKEKSIVEQEAIFSFDDHIHRFYLNRFKSFFPNQRISIPVIGELEDIKKIHRNAVLKFYERCYNTDSFVITVCSDDSEQEVFNMANEYFGHMKHTAKNTNVIWQYNDKKEIYLEQKKEVNQVTLALSYLAPKMKDSAEYPFSYVSGVLGSSMLSRLFQRLRIETGYAYSVNTGYSRSSDYGLFTLSTSLSSTNFEKASEVIRDELDRIQTEYITDDEYERVKKQILTDLIFYSEKPSNRAKFYTSLALRDIFPESNHIKELEKIKNVTKEQILMSAKQTFSGRLKIGVLSKDLSREKINRVW